MKTILNHSLTNSLVIICDIIALASDSVVVKRATEVNFLNFFCCIFYFIGS